LEVPARSVEVLIEVPKWGFVKRGSLGRVDFISPLPCLFNYGSIPGYLGLDGDLLDALVLGPRLPRGARVQVYIHGAIGLTDRGMYDDKLVCSSDRLLPGQRERVLRFMVAYGRCKRLLNLLRGRSGPTRCEGWVRAEDALRRARMVDDCWRGPVVPF
jgi:inorganic pyrophosphatase